MKQKRKQIFKIKLLLIAAFLTLISCEKDDGANIINDNLQRKSTIKTVSAENIPDVINFIKSKSNSKMEFTLDDNNSVDGMMKNYDDNLIITTVLADQIKQVTNSYGKSNYTFTMSKGTGIEEVYFLNLVVIEYIDTFYILIAKYVPDSVWLTTYIDESDFALFTGQVYYYDVEGLYIGLLDVIDGKNISAQYRHPCEGTGGGSDSGGGIDIIIGDTGGGDTGSGGGGCSWVASTVATPCSCPPAHTDPSLCNCDNGPGTSVIYSWECAEIKSAIRHSCDDPVEDCYDAVGDPCTCDSNGECIPDDQVENNDTSTNVDISDFVELVRNCRLLDDLSNSPSFALRMQELIDNTTGNTERGYWGRNNTDGEMEYDTSDRFEGVPGVREITLNLPTSPIDSYIHNHFNNGLGSFSIFSGGDLFTLFTLFDNGFISDVDNFVMVVATPHNTVYAITISDADDFQNFGNLFLGNIDTIENMYVFPFGIDPNISNELNEFRLTRLLENQKLGLRLYRGDTNDLNNWTRLKLRSNGELKENNCN